MCACYEAGPTGFGLYLTATAAGVRVEVVAPGKTPRGPSDRVKTDRKDAELLARLLLAGSLTAIAVGPVKIEAARELMRAHDACRRDLMTARHRISKMLLRHGRVYPQPTTWTVAHRRWLARQQFEEAVSELVFADLIAATDGLTARKAAIAERLSRLAQDEEWWPRVGVNLTNRQQGQPDHVSQIAHWAQQRLHRVYHRMRARGKPHNVIVLACARELALLPLGSSNSRLTPADSPTGREAGAPGHTRPPRAIVLWTASAPGMPRPFLGSARRQHKTGPWGDQSPHHQTGNADTAPGVPASRSQPTPARRTRLLVPT